MQSFSPFAEKPSYYYRVKQSETKMWRTKSWNQEDPSSLYLVCWEEWLFETSSLLTARQGDSSNLLWPHSDLYLWFFLRWYRGAHCSHYQEHWESFEECWIGFEPPRKGQRESERVKCWFWLEFRERVGQDNRNLRALDENLAKGF